METHHKYFGLDPLFWCYVKLSVSQVNNAIAHPTLPGIFSLSKDSSSLHFNTFRMVEICGFVLLVNKKPKKTNNHESENDDNSAETTLNNNNDDYIYGEEDYYEDEDTTDEEDTDSDANDFNSNEFYYSLLIHDGTDQIYCSLYSFSNNNYIDNIEALLNRIVIIRGILTNHKTVLIDFLIPINDPNEKTLFMLEVAKLTQLRQ